MSSDFKRGIRKRYRIRLDYYNRKKYAKADEAFRPAVHGQERTLEQDHKDTLNSKNWLGSALYSQNKHKEAEEMLRQAVQGRERTLG